MPDTLPYIQFLLDDLAIERIIIDGWQRVLVEKESTLWDIPTPFQNEQELWALIHILAKAQGVPIQDAQSIYHLRLPDGGHVEMILPPVSPVGPALTLLKYQNLQPLSIEDLLRFGSITQPAVDFVRACVKAKVNLVISGGTSAGKITLLRMFAEWIDPRERILLLENASGIDLPHPRRLSLETRPPDADGKGEVTLRDLVKSALRMRPDRLIILELMGAETFELIYAMNHGHDGCLCSVHSNGPRDTLARLELMFSMGDPEIPLVAVREQICAALGIIVHLERMKDGSRKVTYISEVRGMENGAIALFDIFVFEQTGMVDGRVQGSLLPTGIRPMALDKLAEAGIELPKNLFKP